MFVGTIQLQRVAKANDYNKVHACYYCQKLVKKIGRHLISVHRNETDVQIIASIPVKQSENEDKRRSLALDKLRNLGDFMHNVDVLTNKNGILITARRLTQDQMHTFHDYLPCRYCMTFFYSKELWRHVKNCAFRNNPITNVDNMRKCERDAQKAGRLLLAGASMSRVASENKEFMQHIIHTMVTDSVSASIQCDPLLLQLGAVLFTKLGVERASDLRCRLRYLGKLKIELAEQGLHGGYNELLLSQNFDAFVKATQSLCIVSTEKTLNGCMKLVKPHVALKLGQFLRKTCQIKRGRAIRSQSTEERQQAEDFLLLLDSDWSDKIGSLARQSVSESKYNKKELLPLTRDLLKLKLYQEKSIAQTTVELLAKPTIELFDKLATLTLSRLVTFNKRRPAEPSKLKIDTYQTRTNWQQGNAEICATLSQFERGLLKRYVTPTYRVSDFAASHFLTSLDQFILSLKSGYGV